MKYVEVSEPVFRDLIGCKSKIEDIKVMLDDADERITKRKLIQRLKLVVNSARYAEKEAQ